MNKTEKPEQLISLEELCDFLKVRKSYIYRLTSENKIPYYRISGLKFKLSEIRIWVEKNKIKTRSPKSFKQLIE